MSGVHKYTTCSQHVQHEYNNFRTHAHTNPPTDKNVVTCVSLEHLSAVVILPLPLALISLRTSIVFAEPP